MFTVIQRLKTLDTRVVNAVVIRDDHLVKMGLELSWGKPLKGDHVIPGKSNTQETRVNKATHK